MSARVTWLYGPAKRRPFFEQCQKCHKSFAPDDQIVIREEHTNWFRGDDDISAFCQSCGTKVRNKEMGGKP